MLILYKYKKINLKTKTCLMNYFQPKKKKTIIMYRKNNEIMYKKLKYKKSIFNC